MPLQPIFPKQIKLVSQLLALCFIFGFNPKILAQEVMLKPVPVQTMDEGELTFLRDPSREMTLTEAKEAWQQGRFKQLKANLGLGYTPNAVWLHLTLHQPQKESKAEASASAFLRYSEIYRV
ncbi:MAG: hypothetical protein HQL49_09755 [Gammaproteobacteria bacterium]|nr:hypothetical protein [Gammaproteobacteria bacterium]